jgi:hypothetical protein
VGVNNKQRRAAKKKKSRQRTRPAGAWDTFVPEPTAELARSCLLEVLAVIDAEPSRAAELADALMRPDALIPPDLTRQALSALLAELTAGVVAAGWLPSDLVQIVTRQLKEARVPMTLALLAAEMERHPRERVAPAWRDELAAAGPAVAADLRVAAAVPAALELATCLATLPPIAVLIPPPGKATDQQIGGGSGDPRLLAKVRALLAKAESTEYDEEADALSAKAQELISRHALERLLAESDGVPTGDAGGAPVARRIWLDPPYVFAKAMLVGAVADANRCRSVVSEGLGFCTVLGQEDDLVAVDLLVTSLLVQAATALRRHGRQTDSRGVSRTKSFRQSFLVSYASRIGERLQDVTEEAVQDTGRSGDLVPVLHLRAEQIDAATESLFPHLISRPAAIGNARGWVAGRVAADLAVLGTDDELTEAAS